MDETLDELDDDPAFRLLRKYATAFMRDADDPEGAFEEFDEDDIEAAYERLGKDPQEASMEAGHLADLAREVAENNPELIVRLREEYETAYGADAPPA